MQPVLLAPTPPPRPRPPQQESSVLTVPAAANTHSPLACPWEWGVIGHRVGHGPSLSSLSLMSSLFDKPALSFNLTGARKVKTVAPILLYNTAFLGKSKTDSESRVMGKR